jgi:phospholipase/carboxylesterase
MQPERAVELAGLTAIAIGPDTAARAVVVLHGRAMTGADLAPFAHALGVDARFLFPDAAQPTTPRGRAWWRIDEEARARVLAAGPPDLHAIDPAGRAEARATLAALLAEVRAAGARHVTLVGFSQGGMLAMDHVLHGGAVDALALLSSSRIAFADWQPRLSRLAGLPVLVSHGRDDAELAFAAGEALRDAAIAGGAEVTWVAFDGPHEIPLVVWRALRRFLRR